MVIEYPQEIQVKTGVVYLVGPSVLALCWDCLYTSHDGEYKASNYTLTYETLVHTFEAARLLLVEKQFNADLQEL